MVEAPGIRCPYIWMGYDVRPLKLGFEDLVKEGFEKAKEEKKKDEKN